MPTLTPQQRKFLEQRLKVKKPEKKGFFSRATAEEKSDKQVEKDYGSLVNDIAKVEAAIDKLDALVGKTPAAQVPVLAFRKQLGEVDRLMQKTTEQDAASVFKALKGALVKLLDSVNAAVKKQEANPESKARGDYAAALADAKRQLELLKVIPNAKVQTFSGFVEAAEQSASPDTEAGYQKALKELAGCGEEFKSVQAAATKAQKADVAQSAKKPDALTALAVAASELAALERLPACEATATNFSKILKDARKLADGNLFADALDELKKLKSLPSLAESVAASNKAAAGLKGNKGYDDGIALLAKLREIVTPADLAEHDRRFQAAVKEALAAKANSPDLTPAASTLQEAVNAATQAKTGLEALKTAIAKARADFVVVSSKGDIALVDAKAAPLKSLESAKDFVTASRLAAELLGQLDAGIAARRRAHADWLAAKDKPPLLVKEIDQLRKSAQCEAVRLEMLTLMYKVTDMEVKRLCEAAEWAKLVANVAQVGGDLAQARAKEAEFGSFEPKRKDAAKEVEGLVASARASITALEAAVTQAGKAVGAEEFAAGAVFSGRLDRIEKSWAAKLERATNDAELKLETTRAELTTLSKEIAAAAAPAAIQQSLNGNAQKLAQARFETDWEVLQAEILKLQAVDNEAASKASAEADAIRQGGRADWRAALGAVAKLNSRVAAERVKLAQVRDSKAAAVAKTVKDVKAQIETLKDSTRSGKFGPFFEALRLECEQFELLAKSPSGDAIAEAELGLKDMQARIKKFTPGDAAQAGGPTLDKVATALASSEASLKKINEVLSANCPKTLAKLNKDLAALRASLAKQDPKASMKAVETFDAACVAAGKEAEKVIEVRTEYTQLLPSVQAASAAFSKQKSAPEYAKALEQRIEEIVKQAKNPNELYAALQKLHAVDEELKDAALKPGAAVAKEGQIREKKKADAAAEAEWKRSLELFEDQRLDEAQAAVKAGGAKGLIDELKNMLKAAKQTAGKGDHVEALKQLHLADQRAEEVIANPQGASIGARNNLPADAALYKEAVIALRDLLGGFPQQVAAAMPTLPKAVTQRLGERVSSLAARFDPVLFDALVQGLIAPSTDDKARRKLREDALAQVRSTRSLFSSHPLMVSLAKSPVAAAELSAALRRVDNSLNRLDANISRSCA